MTENKFLTSEYAEHHTHKNLIELLLLVAFFEPVIL